MADFVYDDAPMEESRGATTRRLVNLTGAAVSTALVIGMGIWGYKLMVRDVTGIPVIEAIDGAFRTQPEDSGGMQAPHQGLQVNEIAAGGTASDAAEEVALAPDPQPLSSEDVPMGELPSTGTTDDIAGAGEGASIPDPIMEEPTEAVPDVAVIETPETVEEESQATDLAVAEAMAALGGNGGEPVVDPEIATPRPTPRPEDAPADVASGAPADDGSIGVGEVSVEALSEGTRLVQLGAFESPEVAREHWRDVGERFAGAFAGKRMVVQEATSGGQAFYRLRAEGFENGAAAQDFCSALLAGRADCIPVEVR